MGSKDGSGSVKKAVARPRKKSDAVKAVKKTNPRSRQATPQPPSTTGAAVNPWTNLLDDGDKVEFGATMELKDRRGRSYWPKMAVTVQKRPDETVEQTVARASQIVHEGLDAHAHEFLGD